MISHLVIVDNQEITRIGKVAQWVDDADFTISCYDHHTDVKNKVKCDYYHFLNTGACTSILIEKMIQEGIQITPFEANMLALGIYEDTGNFLYQDVAKEDFAAMSYLISVGADIAFIKRYIKREFTQQQIHLMNRILREMNIQHYKGIDIVHVAISMDQNDINVSNIVQTLKQSEHFPMFIGLFLFQNRIQLVIRNDYDFIPIEEIARNLGGGGHRTAASAVIHSEDVILTQDYILQKIKKFLDEHDTANEIMKQNVEMLTPEVKVETAYQYLLEHEFSTLIIGKSKIEGIATKKDLANALHNGKAKDTLAYWTKAPVFCVQSTDSIYEIGRAMVDMNIGRIPVLKKDRFVGLITRSDLLRAHVRVDAKTAPKERYAFDNVASILKRYVSENVYQVLRQVGHFGSQEKTQVYVVGGFVRDFLMNRENYDLDFVVEGDAISFAKKFKAKFGKKIVLFEKFGTAIVISKLGLKLDFATSRTEYYEQPGMLPKVKKASLKSDLYRRDFTINALAVKLNSEQFGLLIDFHKGRKDIRNKIIRTMHNISFIDDPTRILRAIRFEQRFNFKIDHKTLSLLRNSLNINVFQTISKERIREELVKACNESNPDNFFLRLSELGILKILYEPLTFNYKHIFIYQNIFENRIWFEKTFPHRNNNFWVCHLMVLVIELSQRSAMKFADKYRLGNVFKQSIKDFYEYKEKDRERMISKLKNSEIVEILKRFSEETILFLIAFEQEITAKQNMRKFLQTLRYVKPILTGKDLLQMGFKTGPEIGQLLKLLLDFKLNDTLQTKEQERGYAIRFFNAKQYKLLKKNELT